jgi:hypothetical protein
MEAAGEKVHVLADMMRMYFLQGEITIIRFILRIKTTAIGGKPSLEMFKFIWFHYEFQ